MGMPRDGPSKNWSAGELERVEVRTYVARNELTVLRPNTSVSPKAVVWAVLRLFGPKMFCIARISCVRSSVAGRSSMWLRYRPVYGMVGVQLIIYPDNALPVVVVERHAKPDLATRIGLLRNESGVGDLHCRFRGTSAGLIWLFTNGAFSVTCLPALHAGEAAAVKSPASMAAVGTNARLSFETWRERVRW